MGGRDPKLDPVKMFTNKNFWIANDREIMRLDREQEALSRRIVELPTNLPAIQRIQNILQKYDLLETKREGILARATIGDVEIARLDREQQLLLNRLAGISETLTEGELAVARTAEVTTDPVVQEARKLLQWYDRLEKQREIAINRASQDWVRARALAPEVKQLSDSLSLFMERISGRPQYELERPSGRTFGRLRMAFDPRAYGAGVGQKTFTLGFREMAEMMLLPWDVTSFKEYFYGGRKGIGEPPYKSYKFVAGKWHGTDIGKLLFTSGGVPTTTGKRALSLLAETPKDVDPRWTFNIGLPKVLNMLKTELEDFFSARQIGREGIDQYRTLMYLSLEDALRTINPQEIDVLLNREGWTGRLLASDFQRAIILKAKQNFTKAFGPLGDRATGLTSETLKRYGEADMGSPFVIESLDSIVEDITKENELAAAIAEATGEVVDEEDALGVASGMGKNYRAAENRLFNAMIQARYSQDPAVRMAAQSALVKELHQIAISTEPALFENTRTRQFLQQLGFSINPPKSGAFPNVVYFRNPRGGLMETSSLLYQSPTDFVTNIGVKDVRTGRLYALESGALTEVPLTDLSRALTTPTLVPTPGELESADEFLGAASTYSKGLPEYKGRVWRERRSPLIPSAAPTPPETQEPIGVWRVVDQVTGEERYFPSLSMAGRKEQGWIIDPMNPGQSRAPNFAVNPLKPEPGKPIYAPSEQLPLFETSRVGTRIKGEGFTADYLEKASGTYLVGLPDIGREPFYAGRLYRPIGGKEWEGQARLYSEELLTSYFPEGSMPGGLTQLIEFPAEIEGFNKKILRRRIAGEFYATSSREEADRLSRIITADLARRRIRRFAENPWYAFREEMAQALYSLWASGPAADISRQEEWSRLEGMSLPQIEKFLGRSIGFPENIPGLDPRKAAAFRFSSAQQLGQLMEQMRDPMFRAQLEYTRPWMQEIWPNIRQDLVSLITRREEQGIDQFTEQETLKRFFAQFMPQAPVDVIERPGIPIQVGEKTFQLSTLNSGTLQRSLNSILMHQAIISGRATSDVYDFVEGGRSKLIGKIPGLGQALQDIEYLPLNIVQRMMEDPFSATRGPHRGIASIQDVVEREIDAGELEKFLTIRLGNQTIPLDPRSADYKALIRGTITNARMGVLAPPDEYDISNLYYWAEEKRLGSLSIAARRFLGWSDAADVERTRVKYGFAPGGRDTFFRQHSEELGLTQEWRRIENIKNRQVKRQEILDLWDNLKFEDSQEGRSFRQLTSAVRFEDLTTDELRSLQARQGTDAISSVYSQRLSRALGNRIEAGGAFGAEATRLTAPRVVPPSLLQSLVTGDMMTIPPGVKQAGIAGLALAGLYGMWSMRTPGFAREEDVPTTDAVQLPDGSFLEPQQLHSPISQERLTEMKENVKIRVRAKDLRGANPEQIHGLLQQYVQTLSDNNNISMSSSTRDDRRRIDQEYVDDIIYKLMR
jgi:hypothetical protein